MLGNKINHYMEVLKSQTLTLHGNPLSRLVNNYRCIVLFYLPQIKSKYCSFISRQDRIVVPSAICTVGSNKLKDNILKTKQELL